MVIILNFIVVLIIKHSMVNSSYLFIGKYYLVDAGYTNGPGFLAPYHSTYYHLNEWLRCDNSPRTYKELFNLHHSSVRNVIERTFGLLIERTFWHKNSGIVKLFFNLKRDICIFIIIIYSN